MAKYEAIEELFFPGTFEIKYDNYTYRLTFFSDTNPMVPSKVEELDDYDEVVKHLRMAKVEKIPAEGQETIRFRAKVSSFWLDSQPWRLASE